MKKNLTIFTAAAIVLILAGCVDGQGAETGLQEDGQETVRQETGRDTGEEENRGTGQGAGREVIRNDSLMQENGISGNAESFGENASAQQGEAAELREDYEDNFDVDEKSAAAFGRMIKEAVAQKNVEMLADLTEFPVYVGLSGGIVVETREDFIALDVEELLSDEMVSSIAEADENDLSPSMAGFTLYGSDGAPSMTFGVREGHLAISGINYGY